jgi:hypothetical protein
MNKILQKIEEFSKGLYYLSESDYPLVPFYWQIKPEELHSKLIAESAKSSDGKVEKVSLQYFFRNMVKLDDHEIANRFMNLQQFLLEKLNHVEVYRVGKVQVKVFIVGQLPDGNFAGLSTTSIET